MPSQVPSIARSRRAAAVPILLLVAAVVVLGGLAASGALGPIPSADSSPTHSPTASPSPTPTPTPTTSASPTPSPSPSASPVAICPYDGLPAATTLETPVLISIDNAPEARPGTGMNDADIVFENPVQGNSTRFVALFGCNADVEVVGPVRSGRWIQVDLWQQLRVLPIIYGAAPYSTTYFAEQGMPLIDGNVESWPFFSRLAGRPAPYNVYLDMGTLQELLSADESLATRVTLAGEPRPILSFDPDWTAPEDARRVASIDMRTASFWEFGWRYDDETGVYVRLDAGSETTDAASGDPLTRRTIIVQRAVSERTFADARSEADPPIQRLVGSGDGVVYVDGIAIDVRWTRPSASGVTDWTVVATGEKLVLPPGQVWWEILPIGSALTEG